MSGVEETHRRTDEIPVVETAYLETTNQTNPRSALRHRPIRPANAATENTPLVPRASRKTRKINTEEPETEPGRGSELRPIGTATKAIAPPETATQSPVKSIPLHIPRTRAHWLIWLGLGMGVMLLGVMLVQVATGWITTLSDDLHYGRPRTFQIDAFVGHETGKVASHFLVINLHGQIQIIEMPGGDPQQIRVFTGPHLVGNNAELIPATISFVDTRHDQHPDMYLQAGNLQVIFRNTDGTFKVVQE